MKKRIFCLLMCVTVLFGTFPSISFADDTNAQSGAKFGIKRGDIVTYAGSDSPIEWRVIDAEKSNTDDENGMLLLSNNTKFAAKQSLSSITGLRDEYENFYNTYFDDFYKSSVMTVSKKDESYTYNRETYEGELENDTIFALSKAEAENLTDNERKFAEQWWLRSVKLGKGLIYDGITGPIYDETQFALVQSDGLIRSTSIAEPTNVYLRPSVNIDKTKLANLDGLPLLLPAGEFAEAEECFTPTGTADKWKLSNKNEEVKIEKAYSDSNIHNSSLLKLYVTTNLTRVTDNDYISVIIRKNDGSISHYGRYQISYNPVVNVALPSDIDMDNDSMYVFYENFKGALSGSVSELVKVCIKHDFEYETTEEKHHITCKNCTYESSGDHYVEEFQGDDVKHTGACIYCGYIISGEHEYSDVIGNEKKNFTCSRCGKHTFTAKLNDFDKSDAFLREDEFIKGSEQLSEDFFTTDTLYELFIKAADADVALRPFSDSKKAAVFFKTKHAVKAIGIQTSIHALEYAPSTITLYGRNSDSEEYKKIGTVVLKQILNYDNQTCSALFADTAPFAAYNDYKLEAEAYSSQKVVISYFGLLSVPGAALDLTAKGAASKDIPDYVYPEVDSSFTILSKGGHPKKDEIKITADGEPLDDNFWSYSEESGICTLFGEYISSAVKNYNISVECSDSAVKVETELSPGLEFSGADTTEFGSDYVCTFTDSYGDKIYTPAKKDIKVLCDETDITEYCNLENDTLTVPGSFIVGSVIKIIASEAGLNKTDASIIQIERPGKLTRWYDSFADALKDIHSGGDMSITLIGNEEYMYISRDERLFLENTNIILDLGGKTISFGRYVPITLENNADVTIKNGTINNNVSDNACAVRQSSCRLTISSVSIPENGIFAVGGKVIVDNSTDSKLYGVYVAEGGSLLLKKGIISNVMIEKPYNIKLINGTVENMINSDDTEIVYSDFLENGCEYYNILDSEAFEEGRETGFSVRCLHKKTDTETGKCTVCDYMLPIKTVNGETVKYYDNITEAVEYANENADTVIKLFKDVTVKTNGTFDFKGENTILDLNGKSFTITGFPLIYVYGTLTITGNGIIDTAIETFTSADYESLVIVENGEFKKSIGGKFILNGGKFAAVIADNVGDLLGKDKVYQNADGTFTASSKNISNVTVTDVPFVITKQPEGKLILDTSSQETVSFEISAALEYENDITYQWYECERIYNETYDFRGYTDIIMENCTSRELQLPTNLSNGEQKIYKCDISCNGYVISTNHILFTFGSKAPLLKYDSTSDLIYANGYGKDCVLAMAVYSGSKLLDIKTENIKASDGLFISYLNINKTNADTAKVFLWDGFDTINPIAEPVKNTYNLVSVSLYKQSFDAYSEYIDCTVIVASYNGNKLVDFKSVCLDESNDYSVEKSFDEIGLNTENSTEIKAFVWEDFQSMKPIGFDLYRQSEDDDE